MPQTDQYSIGLPEGYRYASEKELDIHLNSSKIPGAVWVWAECLGLEENFQYDLAVPIGG